jgi:hypothetical protein
MTIQELKNEIIVSLEKFNEDNNCSISEIELGYSRTPNGTKYYQVTIKIN